MREEMNPSIINTAFKLMALQFKIRDFFRPRAEFLQEIPIEPGSQILDFGCGPGSYTLVAAERVGPNGKIYALDILPVALEYVQDGAFKQGLNNIETLQADSTVPLPDASVNFVFLFDIFHLLDRPEQVLEELQRVLIPGGTLCVNDHHMQKKDIIRSISLSGRFVLKNQGKNILQFGVI
jgi:ubiquinone/menaquinone biosynthesis C-methylase UbiE